MPCWNPTPAPCENRAWADRPRAKSDAAPLSSALDDVHLRTLRGGDVGLVAHRLAVLQQQGKQFDAEVDRRLLARAAAFLENFDRARDIGWIAERDHRLAGACLLKGERTGASGAGMAEVSMIHVEPEARGIGLARMLLDQCLAFAAIVKYTSVTARVAGGETEIADALEAMEFRIVRRERAAALGRDELERVWEKRL
jgi:GNAT superfamily N-acetyltransferase